MEEKNKPSTPRCGFKAALPHLARPAYLLVWDLPSGPVVRWSCAEHRYRFGGNRGYWVNRTEGYADNGNLHSQKLAALLDISEEARPREKMEDEERAFGESDENKHICVYPACGKLAREGKWCVECQSQWEVEQRAKARRERRSVNVQRGF
ncbi:MAG: hypothetical protein WA734_07035 [Candidatus Acidiferrales bacterium]